MKPETIKIDEVEYVRKDSVKEKASKLDGYDYVIVRTYSAGVFAGYLKSRNGQEIELLNARRIYQWAGAATLSQLAVEGTSEPKSCKFPMEVPSIELTQAIEIIPCTEKARLSIASVEVWRV